VPAGDHPDHPAAPPESDPRATPPDMARHAELSVAALPVDAAAEAAPATPVEPDSGATQHPNGRWIVGAEGLQPNVVPRIAGKFKSPPPDVVINGAKVRSIDFRAASIRGLRHEERGEPRQDAYAVRFTQDQRWLVCCIADGVSQAKRSHEAAATVVERVTEALVGGLTRRPPSDELSAWPAEACRLPWQQALDAANAEVMEIAREHLIRIFRRQNDLARVQEMQEAMQFGHARSVMATTALAVVVATEPTGGVYPAVMANIVGDSSAFVLQGARWVPLTPVKNEGAAIYEGAVKSLPAAVEVRPKPFFIEPGDSFLAMTDGLGDPLGRAKGQVGEFLADKWRTPPDLLDFAQHLGFYRRSFADDRTALMVWPAPVRAIP
jgi:hypothetical protein